MSKITFDFPEHLYPKCVDEIKVGHFFINSNRLYQVLLFRPKSVDVVEIAKGYIDTVSLKFHAEEVNVHISITKT